MRTLRRAVRAMAVSGVLVLGACVHSGPSGGRDRSNLEDPRGDWFVRTGCVSCHSVSVYGLENPAAVAPDLSMAAASVPKRFGRPLEDFLRAPTGTMALVFAGRIPLDEAGKRTARDKLEEAHALYRRRQQAADAAHE